MRHAGTQTIETERLLLRPLTPEDAPMMYANWAKTPDVTRWQRIAPHKNVAENRDLWAIVEKSTRQVVGSIGVCTSSSAEPERDPWPGFDHTNGVWEVGYCIGKAWWNKGFTTEALKAVVEYWFKNTDSSWLACCHAFENPASGRVQQKAGFVYDHDVTDRKLDGTPVPCRAYHLVKEDL